MVPSASQHPFCLSVLVKRGGLMVVRVVCGRANILVDSCGHCFIFETDFS